MGRTSSAAVVGLLLVGLASSRAAAQPAAVAAPASASALSTDEQLEFLRSARIVSSRMIGKGTTGALRVVLSSGAVTHDAAFQGVAQEGAFGRRRGGELRFVDHYRYNIAAWRLASHLGLGQMMPPTIERAVAGVPGALSWWVDDVMFDEAERELKNAQPLTALDFSRQRQRMTLFAELVRDTDRNKGNILYTSDWRVVMLDFTRAFRLEPGLRPTTLLTTCSRALLAVLRGLSRDDVRQAVKGSLTGDEVSAVMARRDLLVAHFDRLIAERGENIVLY